MNRTTAVAIVPLLVTLSLFSVGCERPPTPASSPKIDVPGELQQAVADLVRAVEALDVPKVLESYADDFTSGTGRSKEAVREVLTQLQNNRVSLKVESAEVEEVGPAKAKLKTRLRLRYPDRFRDLGEGEVVVTDVLVHSLRKEAERWKIYADKRVSTYREGRFGEQSPNVKLEVPGRLPNGVSYSVTVSVQRAADHVYQVMLGNYPEDPEFLPPPDIMTMLPDDGVLKADLIRNPQGRNEMVRTTVIATNAEGTWVGATTVSKLIPSVQQEEPDVPQEKV